MARANQVQYKRPRCPRCKKIAGKRLGYDLDFEPSGSKARITCRLCHFSWLSASPMALAEVKDATAKPA